MKQSALTLKKYAIVFCLTAIICSAGMLFAQKTHNFKPTKYYFTYDADHEPVLKLRPGDTLITSTLDAFGNAISSSDQKASEVVELLKVRPNRDYAVSTQLPHFGVLTGETYTAMLIDPLPEKTYIWKLVLLCLFRFSKNVEKDR